MPEQHERNAARQAHAAERSQRMWDAAREATEHPYLSRKGVGAYGVRIGEFWKERQDGTAYLAAKDALLIRMRDGGGTTGLQAIYSRPVKVGEESRHEDFVEGAKKEGCWATIGKPSELNGRVTLLVVEGYATGASVHEATGLGVIVAFDAGNLLAVGREVRRLMPNARLVFAADNDLTTARAAAESVGGELVTPAFADVSEKPTDWNDLHVVAGIAEVRRQLMAILDPPAEPEPEMPPEPPPIEDISELGPVDDDPPASKPPVPQDRTEELDNPYFTVRGHGRGTIIIQHHESKMLVERGAADWGEAALTSIAPLHWWELNFPGEKGLNKKLAVNWLQRTAYKKGFFDPNSLRGRGAWRDDGRYVYHFGDHLCVDGEVVDLGKIDSRFIYEQGPRMPRPADEPLSNADGKRLFEAFQLFRWTRPASAILLAGYAVLAPVAGALDWRPHVWITGGAGAGKTTLLNFVHWLLQGNEASVYAQGNSTEAGIRQRLRTDALPVLFDESEQNNERETLRMQNVISLIRQSSTESGAQTLKGTQGGSAMHFTIRSMFCLGSIQVGLKQQADMERISVLSLKPKRDGAGEDAAATESWKRTSGALASLRADRELPAKLLRRTLTLLPVIAQNIVVFAQAAAEKFGSQRDGDQYGALLAGAWSLCSDKLATLDEARAMIARYDWSDYLEGSETEESDKALAALMGRMIRFNGEERSVYEVFKQAAMHANQDAGDTIERYGLKVRWAGSRATALLVGYNHIELNDLMKGTPYTDLKGQLLRLPGVTRASGSVPFHGVRCSAAVIPIEHIIEGEPVTDYSDFS